MINNKSSCDINSPQLEISDSGIAVLDKSWKCENGCDPFTRLYYIKEGSGYLKYGSKTIKMTAGNVYLIPSFLTFSYGCDYMKKIYFHISIKKIDKYDLMSEIKNILSLPVSQKDITKLMELYNSDDYMSILSLRNEICKTVIDFSKKYNFGKTPIKEYSQTVKKTIRYIHLHTKINLSVNEISKNLFISESKIRKSFKEEVGVTIGEYIDDTVFFKAKSLLRNKDILIGEISEALGFCDQFYFSRRFKEKYQKTPTMYRKEIII